MRIWDSRRTLPIDSNGDFEIHQVLYGCRTYIEDGTSLDGPKGKKSKFTAMQAMLLQPCAN